MSAPLTVGSLFAGVGGLELGLERAGMQVRWQVEVDDFCQRVLARHWPHVARHRDVRDVGGHNLERVDVICGGFPCTDISSANTSGGERGAGLGGEYSGLWREYLRVVDELRPRWVLVENSPEWREWVPEVRSGLWVLGYASLPLLLRASDFGAPHDRPRAFVVAHADRDGKPLRAVHAEVAGLPPLSGEVGHWRNAPALPVGVDDGIPRRMDRLRTLGNAVAVPVAAYLGRVIAHAGVRP